VPAPDRDPKKALREEARAARRAACDRFGTRIGPILAANFFARFSHPRGYDFAGYWPIREEADIRPLLTALHERGHRLALPRVVRRGAPLRFLRWRPGDCLAPGYAGIPEPAADGEEIVPDVLLVPLLGFDRAGRRLGYGGGFYDRTLGALRRRGAVEAIGIGYSEQEVDSLPPGDHDEPLDWIVTELGCRRLRASGPGGEANMEGPAKG
jgi:5-formyltetrahydrofolate cyclo-ligase